MQGCGRGLLVPTFRSNALLASAQRPPLLSVLLGKVKFSGFALSSNLPEIEDSSQAGREGPFLEPNCRGAWPPVEHHRCATPADPEPWPCVPIALITCGGEHPPKFNLAMTAREACHCWLGGAAFAHIAKFLHCRKIPRPRFQACFQQSIKLLKHLGFQWTPAVVLLVPPL